MWRVWTLLIRSCFLLSIDLRTLYSHSRKPSSSPNHFNVPLPSLYPLTECSDWLGRSLLVSVQFIFSTDKPINPTGAQQNSQAEKQRHFTQNTPPSAVKMRQAFYLCPGFSCTIGSLTIHSSPDIIFSIVWISTRWERRNLWVTWEK